MSASTRLTGTDLVVEFLPEGGVAGTDEIVLTSDFTSFSFNRSVETVDVTASNEKERTVKETIESMDFNIMLFDAEQTYQADILPKACGLLSVYPTGKTSGEKYFSFNMILTGYSEDFPFDGALEIEVAGQRQGAMVAEIGSTYTV